MERRASQVASPPNSTEVLEAIFIENSTNYARILCIIMLCYNSMHNVQMWIPTSSKGGKICIKTLETR